MTSVEGLIFWLVPVILLVVLISIVANHVNSPRRRKLYFLEPLGTLITTWRSVRLIGESSPLRTALTWLAGSDLSEGTPLEWILKSPDTPSRRAAEFPLLHQQSIGSWGEQRVVQHGGRPVSIVAGSVDAVLDACRYRSDGRLLLTDSDKAEHRLTAERAGEHGFLAVAVGIRYFHGRVYEPDKHTWLGMIFFEPVYDEQLLGQLRHIDPSRMKLLSYLPEPFLHSVLTKIRGVNQFAGIPRRPVITPLEQERLWQESAAIGSADAALRHAIVRYFESRRDCWMISGIAADRKLPLPVRRVI